jgi:hypothetical protein
VQTKLGILCDTNVENTILWLKTKAKHELPLMVFEGANGYRKELEERIDLRGCSLLVLLFYHTPRKTCREHHPMGSFSFVGYKTKIKHECKHK